MDPERKKTTGLYIEETSETQHAILRVHVNGNVPPVDQDRRWEPDSPTEPRSRRDGHDGISPAVSWAEEAQRVSLVSLANVVFGAKLVGVTGFCQCF